MKRRERNEGVRITAASIYSYIKSPNLGEKIAYLESSVDSRRYPSISPGLMHVSLKSHRVMESLTRQTNMIGQERAETAVDEVL